MRSLGLVVALSLIACGPSDRDEPEVAPDACEGIGCRVVNCAQLGKPPTTISGKVYAPNRTLTLFGVNVYIPLSDPGPMQEGATCGRCSATLPGGSAAHVQSGADGSFTLTNVPSGLNIPLVITVGKWRRRVDIPEVVACQDNALPVEITSLPRNKLEGDLPKIAIATGSCDALECLVRKIGVSDSEFSNDAGHGSIHMYTAGGSDSIASNGSTFRDATDLWNNLGQLMKYDMALFSCECSQNPDNKSQAAMNNVKMYADAGGRVFLSHYHNIWIDGDDQDPSHKPPVWPEIATCDNDGYDTGSDYIDTVNNPKGNAFSQWMMNVMGSPTVNTIPIQDGRQTCTAIDHTKAERWVYYKDGAQEYPQNFQFTTPNEVPVADRCGKVVFSDMHVASGSSSSGGFPSGCSGMAMTPQEKALAFMFFDIASCVGPIL